MITKILGMGRGIFAVTMQDGEIYHATWQGCFYCDKNGKSAHCWGAVLHRFATKLEISQIVKSYKKYGWSNQFLMDNFIENLIKNALEYDGAFAPIQGKVIIYRTHEEYLADEELYRVRHGIEKEKELKSMQDICTALNDSWAGRCEVGRFNRGEISAQDFLKKWSLGYRLIYTDFFKKREFILIEIAAKLLTENDLKIEIRTDCFKFLFLNRYGFGYFEKGLTL